MHCDKFEERLNDILDQHGTPCDDRELRDHAENCVNCRDMLAGQQTLFAGLELAEPPAMSGGFTQRVLARVADRSDDGKGSTAAVIAPVGAPAGLNRGLLLLGGVVAAMLLAGFVGWKPLKSFFSPPGSAPELEQPLVVNSFEPKPAPQPEIAPPPSPKVNPTTVVQQAPLHQPMKADEQLARVLKAVQTTLPTEEGTELASQVVDGLRPIAEPMSSMINVVRRGLLRDEMPQEEPPRKPQANSPLAEGALRLS